MPGGGNWRTSRVKSPRVWWAARRMVAVEAMIFGGRPSSVQRKSTAVSYKPASVPSGPEMRWSSSWTINSGGLQACPLLKRFRVSSRQGMVANLSLVAMSRVPPGRSSRLAISSAAGAGEDGAIG